MDWLEVAILVVALVTLAFLVRVYRTETPLRKALMRKEAARQELFYAKSILQDWADEVELAKLQNRGPELSKIRGPHAYVGLAWIFRELLDIRKLYGLTDNDLWNKLTDPPFARQRGLKAFEYRLTEDLATLRGAVDIVDRLIQSLG